MKNWISILVAVFLSTTLTGCSAGSSPVPDNSKAYIGLFSGAIAGGLVGSALNEKGGGRVRAVALGAAVGAVAGGAIGLLVSDLDREKANAVARQERYRANNWQRSSSPYAAAPVQAAMQVTAMKPQLVVKKKEAMNVKASSSEKDKFLSILNHLPSFQWFVNDVKQEDIG